MKHATTPFKVTDKSEKIHSSLGLNQRRIGYALGILELVDSLIGIMIDYRHEMEAIC